MRTFAFGRPVLPRPPSTSEPRPAFVLGAYPSGLHVKWTPSQPVEGQRFKPVRAMIVDNEPWPFWDGADAHEQFARWRGEVGWKDEWGTVEPADPRFNGPSGTWVAQHILGPLGHTYDDTCISDCLDEARLNAGQAGRIVDTYEPLRPVLGLPPCTLQPVPAGENDIVSEAQAHLDRLTAELAQCGPEVVVTLGNAAVRVMRQLLDPVDTHPKKLVLDGYGTPIEATLNGRAVTWWPLVHPRSGENTPRWRDAHTAWERDR